MNKVKQFNAHIITTIIVLNNNKTCCYDYYYSCVGSINNYNN